MELRAHQKPLTVTKEMAAEVTEALTQSLLLLIILPRFVCQYVAYSALMRTLFT